MELYKLIKQLHNCYADSLLADLLGLIQQTNNGTAKSTLRFGWCSLHEQHYGGLSKQDLDPFIKINDLGSFGHGQRYIIEIASLLTCK